ncbi:hypothetical protein D9758_016743 [Tetrapyrgos nigripes]|uniref:Uncharacterized protein n=1 Tax=Tetrapyrgos nigripes TaxID=182062 RepID=A0A8H5C7M7_9AGAR|nr:hypothetical protein D9758_016743 [Tetrapyrgos nigripes]
MDVDTPESFQAQDHFMDVDSTPIEDSPKLSNSRNSQFETICYSCDCVTDVPMDIDNAGM